MIIPTLFLLLSLFSFVSSSNTDHNQSLFESEKIQEYLKKINKPAVKTIKSPDGDLIDCVLFHQQPAFDHPLLQGHKPITDVPPIPKEFLSDHNETTFDEEVFQVWRMSGESCPDNTVPIRRITEEDVLRTFQRKQETGSDDGYVYEHAIGYVRGSFSYSSASINVWKPQIENGDGLSISQLSVVAGTMENGDRNSIEVGYKVGQDGSPRIFIYWTSDAYRYKGCYNVECPGFVQTSPKVVLGGALGLISKYGGAQFELRCLVWKNPWDKNWWLVMHGIVVGYWPWRLFPLLGEKGLAKELHFGGEVVFSSSSGKHTSTGMGSGHFPRGGFGKAAYIGHILVMEEHNRVVTSPVLKTYETNKGRYYKAEAFLRKTPYVEAYVFYGGPSE